MGPTCCIGPFEAALNLAAPSPDGAWLAVVGDCPNVRAGVAGGGMGDGAGGVMRVGGEVV